jgi:hypothetical protein
MEPNKDVIAPGISFRKAGCFLCHYCGHATPPLLTGGAIYVLGQSLPQLDSTEFIQGKSAMLKFCRNRVQPFGE